MPLARQIRRVVLPCLLLLAGSLPAMARDHLVDPGDPSARAGGPVWPSLGALVTQGEVAGGDRILLAPGRHGAVVTEADSGEAAIACAAGAGFDLIVLDGHMPGLSGLETLARLRAGPQADTPVMAMTADAMTGDAARYLAAGMDGYVPKPVDKTVFLAECERLLGAGRRPVRASGAA